MVTELLTLHNQLKINHWQTESYAEHQALGGTYDALTGLIDEFVEVFMGKYGRVVNKGGFSLDVKNLKEMPSDQLADNYIKFLVEELPSKLDPKKDTDLLNIRDEMLSSLNKLKYLLTLN